MGNHAVLDVLMGIWGVLAMVATASAVRTLVEVGSLVSIAVSACRREGMADCDEGSASLHAMLIWPARRAMALYIATLLVPLGYAIWRGQCCCAKRGATVPVATGSVIEFAGN